MLSAYSLTKISFREDITAIIPKDERITKISNVLVNSKFADRLIINISLKDSSLTDPESLILSAENIFNVLSTDTTHIQNILFKNNEETFLQVYDFFYEHLPLYLNESDYAEIESRLHPDSIEREMEANYKSLTSLVGLVTKDFIFRDPLSLTQIALNKLRDFQLDDNFTIYKNCIFTKDLSHLLIFIEPVFPSGNTKENKKLIERIDHTIRETLQMHSSVNIEYYGGTAVAVSNASAIKKDIMITVTVALILLMILFFLIFRKLKFILLIFFPIILGMLFSISLLVVIGENISAISLGIGAILIGISLDYSLHAFTHYRNMGSMVSALKSISIPVVMSSLTTASAFLCLFIVRSEALNQLGLFAAMAIVITALVVLLVVPFFFSSKPQFNDEHSPRQTILDRIALFPFDQKRISLLTIAALSILFFITSKKLGFNSDLNTLNYMSDELKNAETNLRSISSETSSAVYFIIQAESFEETLEKTEDNEYLLEESISENIINTYTSPINLVHSKEKQTHRIERWNSFWENIGKENIIEIIQQKSAKFNFRQDAFNQFYQLLNKDFHVLQFEDYKPVTDVFLSNYLTQNDSIFSSVTIVKADQDKKNKLFTKFSSTGDFIIFDNQHFTNQFLDILKEDFNLLVWISIILVFSILLIFFGRIEIALITFFPIILSWIWTIGIMGLFGIKFNIFNIIISTFILGLGVDYSIFIMSGLIRNYKYGNGNLSPYKLSVLLSALTTVVALGVLVFARHPALKSIAFVSIAGILSVIVITYSILPVLFRFLVYNKNIKRSKPITFSNFFISIFTVLIFIAGSIGTTLLLPIILILPVKRKQKRLIINYLICFTSKFIVYINITFKKTYVNKHLLNFSKPVVFVSNHQSHLDLVLILLLNPKIIAFTNRWVWNSPFYGMIIRQAGYYPAYKGIDHNIEHLRQKVKEGYSILIFPEGKRTFDGKIGRMHQGAFYIADKLHIDIQPIIIHGARELMEKNEFFLKSGQMTMTFFDRITPEAVNIDRNETYRLQAKKLTEFYRTEFENIRKKTETPAYFRSRLISQYIYKGPVLEWYMKIKLRLEKNYTFFHKIIPENCSITDIGCGYGFMPHMLGLLSEGRNITGIDYDEDKIRVAENCFGDHNRIHFIHTDIFNHDLAKQDVFILSDVLHYFNEEKQEQLIRNCIENLHPGGTIIIRDADSAMKKRHFGTKYTEFFSTKTGFNKMGEERLFFTSVETIRKIISHYNLSFEIVDNTKLTSNVVMIIRKTSAYEN